MNDDTGWLTLLDIERETDIDPSTLRNHIRQSKLRATKRGRDWFVTRADLNEYLKLGIRTRKPHRKRRRRDES